MHWWNAQRLKSKNPQTRRAVIEKLAEHPSPGDLELLSPLLQDPDAGVRKAAAHAIGKLRDLQAVPRLLQALRDSAAEVRERAIIALRQIGDADVAPHLVEMLTDKHPAVRSQAANALERLGWKPQNNQERSLREAARGHFVNAVQAGLPILEVLTKSIADGTATIKRDAVTALGHMGGEEVVAPLVAALRDSDFTVRVAALEALREVTDARALQPMICCLNHSEPSVRAAAAVALGSYGAEALPALVSSLNDSNWSVRTAVVEALGRNNDPALIDTLVPLLKDPDHDVREVTCRALGRIKDVRVVTHLVLAMIDSQTSVREAANIALDEIDFGWEKLPEAKAALPQLKQALNEREYWVRQAARETIKRIEAAEQLAPSGDVSLPATFMDERVDAAVAVLVSLLKHPQRDLRQAAAEALGRFESPQFSGYLAAARGDNDRWVRRSVEEALQKVNRAEAA